MLTESLVTLPRLRISRSLAHLPDSPPAGVEVEGVSDMFTLREMVIEWEADVRQLV